MEIEGDNLLALMDYIGEHRLSWIKSSDSGSSSDVFMMKKGEPEIRAIQMKPKAKKVKAE